AHDVFELFDFLRERRQAPQPQGLSGPCWVEMRATLLRRPSMTDPLLCRSEGCIDRGLHLVKSLARCGLIFFRERAESFLHVLEPTLGRTEVFNSRRFQGSDVNGSEKGRIRFCE